MKKRERLGSEYGEVQLLLISFSQSLRACIIEGAKLWRSTDDVTLYGHERMRLAASLAAQLLKAGSVVLRSRLL